MDRDREYFEFLSGRSAWHWKHSGTKTPKSELPNWMNKKTYKPVKVETY